MIISLLLVIHVDCQQSALRISDMTFLQANVSQSNFITLQEYSFLLFGYFTGSFISRSTLHSSLLTRAYTPTLLQLVNLVLWLFNLKFGFLTSFYPCFFFMLWCGLPGGTAYSNFLYLANTRTKLDCDFKLHYTERELTVNLLLIA